MAKSKKLIKKNKLLKVKDLNCLNCGFPFSGHEVFCPECGQKNKGNTLTFRSFTKEIFNGFISWDAKFWKTIIPLLTKPGEVSKNYIEGKRQRYSNPFRFYLTISVIFFLIVGVSSNIDKLQDLQNGTPASIIDTEIDLDSLLNTNSDDDISFNFKNSSKMGRFMVFEKKHPKVTIDVALDSLQIKKTFSNRFWYSRARFLNKMFRDKETGQNFYKKMLSYSSIALFVLLPFFTLFLRLLYIRRKFTYVEHLVFVFHVQTIFFLLFSLFFIIDSIQERQYIFSIFIGLFLIYLFIAMKKFYNQGFFKTLFKFLLANFIYSLLAFLGILTIMFVAFTMY